MLLMRVMMEMEVVMEKMTVILRDCDENTSGEGHIWPLRLLPPQ